MFTFNYEIRLTDLAIVFATLMGPLLAVQAQKYMERWRDARTRRDRLFKALMATRAARLAPAHVESLNMINIEFPSTNKGFKSVRAAWKAYRSHLGEPMPTNPAEEPVYFAKRLELFTDLLYEMGRSLNYDFDKTEISKEAYSTVFQEKLEADATKIREKLAEILSGYGALPMAVVSFPADQAAIDAQAGYLKLMTEHISQGKPFPVSVVPKDESAKGHTA